MSKKTQVEEVTLAFDLHELPTAQHRAGLAGLIFQIDAMGPRGYRRDPRLVPVITALTATTAEVKFTPDSMQGVFNELYAAKLVEVVVASKRPGEDKSKPGEYFVDKKDPKTGEVKKEKGFAYDVVQPQAPALLRHLAGGREAWLELWRQMVWAILRGGTNVRARAPFIDLANYRPCGEGAKAWAQVIDFRKGLAKSRFKTEPISGALMLGAHSVNAEGVPFSGRVDHNLLLHFWQLVVLTFVPQAVSKKDAKVKRIGYVLAIPDVADLIEFRAELPEIIQGLEATDPRHAPPKARLDLPAQAGLEILRRLRDEAQKAAKVAADAPENVELAKHAGTGEGEGKRFAKRLLADQRRDRIDGRNPNQTLAMGKASREWGNCVRAVETYHMFKPDKGKIVKLLTFSRVVDRPGLVDDYERIDKNHRSPLFRAGLMRALLQERPWHWGMIDLFAEYPHHFFLEIEGETPKYLPHFGRDARALFAAHQQEIREMRPDEMNEEEKIKRLGTIVRNMVTSYVNRKAAKKLGLDWDDFKIEDIDGKKRKVAPDPEKFVEQQRRVCDDAFLQIRSRHDEVFVEFFADSFLSVPHYFEAKAGDQPFLAQILMTPPTRDPVARPARNRDDIKTLAMLALSAYSFNVRKRDAKKEGNP